MPPQGHFILLVVATISHHLVSSGVYFHLTFGSVYRMSSQRYNTPHPSPEDDFSGPSLIFKFDQDPRDITIINPTPDQLETALSHLRVSLHASVLEMVESAVREDTPLNRGILSMAAECSRTHVEERRTTGWTKGQPEATREIIIERLPPQSEQEELAREEEIAFKLILKKTAHGEVEASLTWDIDDMAANLNELRKRWERVDDVCKSWGGAPLPWDLSTLTITPPGAEYRDTHYTHKGLRVGAYPASDEVILDYSDGQTPARGFDDTDQLRLDRDEQDDGHEFELGADSYEDSTASVSSHKQLENYDAHSKEFVEPEGHDILIAEPTAIQLARISRLSNHAISKETFERVLGALRSNTEVDGSAFAATKSDVLENMYFQSKRTYSLKGNLIEERSVAFHDATEENPVAFSIELTSRKKESVGTPEVVEALLHWELLSSDAEVAHWKQILSISNQKHG